jgi:hypothetical protein
VNGRSKTVTETVSRPRRYPFALFAGDGLFFNDKSAAAGAIKASDGTVQAAIGSNRAIVIGSGSTSGAGGAAQNYYSPRGACGGCPNPVSSAGPFATPQPVPPAAPLPAPLPCPGGGVLDGRTTAKIITAGTYLCTGDLTLTGSVSVSVGDPVVIYMTNGNDGSGAPSTLWLAGLVMDATADPTGLQILKAGPGTVDPGGSANAAHFTGVIYAPSANLSSPQCAMTVVGALVLGVFNCAGGSPAFSLTYDSRVAQLLSSAWKPSGYHEIPTPASL